MKNWVGVAEFCLYEEKSGKNWGGCPKIWRKKSKKRKKSGGWVSFWTDLGKYTIRSRDFFLTPPHTSSYNLSFVHINTNIFLFKSVNNSLSCFDTSCNKTGNVSCVAYSRWLALIRMVRENSITVNFVRSHNFDR